MRSIKCLFTQTVSVAILSFMMFFPAAGIPGDIMAQSFSTISETSLDGWDSPARTRTTLSGRHSIDLEILGFSMPYSLGYNFQLNENWSFRAGLGYFDIKSGETNPEILEKYGESFIKATNLPVRVSRLIGRSKHKLELQGGVSLIYFSSSTLFDFSPQDAGWSVSPAAGAAYSYRGNRFVVAAGLTAGLAAWSADNNLLILPGFRWGIRL